MVQKTDRALARRGPELGSKPGQLKLQRWVDALPVSGGSLAVAGLGLAALGIVGAIFNPLGLFGFIVTSSMFTVGAGTTFLAANKGREAPRAPNIDPSVLRERSRRIREAMEEKPGDWTFDQLLRRLRWTEDALVTALVAMRDHGEINEDLNLDSGTWVYRLQDTELVSRGPRSLMLEERKAALEQREPDSD